MTEIQKKLEALRAPVNSSDISWRVGEMTEDKTKGRALPYIDARVVQNRLDEVMGPGNWKNSYTEVFAGNRLLGVRCSLALRIDGEWVSKEDAAYMRSNHSSEESHERALKGAYSDAEKRAAVQWGIARHLYDFEAPWVELVDGKLSTIPALDGSGPPLDGSGFAKVEVVKAASAPADKEEVKPTVTATSAAASEPVAEAAPEQAATEQSQSLSEPPAPREPLDESKYLGAEAETSAASPVDAPAPAPEAASASAPAAAGAEEGTSATYKELLSKLEQGKVTPAMLRNYIRGPKGIEKLSEHERKLFNKRLDAAEEAAKKKAAA